MAVNRLSTETSGVCALCKALGTPGCRHPCVPHWARLAVDICPCPDRSPLAFVLPRPTYLYLLQRHLKNSFIELRSLPIWSANPTALTGAQSCARPLPPSWPVALRGRTAGSCDEEEEEEGGRNQGQQAGGRRGGGARTAEGRRRREAVGSRGRRAQPCGREERAAGRSQFGGSSIFRRESGTSVG